MATVLEVAKQAISKVQKGTPLNKAAEIVRRAIQAKFDGSWYVRKNPNTGKFYVSKVGGGAMQTEIKVTEGGYEHNGLMVTLSQSLS